MDSETSLDMTELFSNRVLRDIVVQDKESFVYMELVSYLHLKDAIIYLVTKF